MGHRTPFELEKVRQGVPKGKRHLTLKQYLGWMVKENYTKENAKETILTWNMLNRPPIPESEIIYDFERFWALWYRLPEDKDGEPNGHE
jgi:hypothetical protein